jgi:hypothetical protein
MRDGDRQRVGGDVGFGDFLQWREDARHILQLSSLRWSSPRREEIMDFLDINNRFDGAIYFFTISGTNFIYIMPEMMIANANNTQKVISENVK